MLTSVSILKVRVEQEGINSGIALQIPLINIGKHCPLFFEVLDLFLLRLRFFFLTYILSSLGQI